MLLIFPETAHTLFVNKSIGFSCIFRSIPYLILSYFILSYFILFHLISCPMSRSKIKILNILLRSLDFLSHCFCRLFLFFLDFCFCFFTYFFFFFSLFFFCLIFLSSLLSLFSFHSIQLSFIFTFIFQNKLKRTFIRDMHKAKSDLVNCQYCLKTFR